MRKPAAFFPILLALGAIILVPGAGARGDAREEGATEIDKCQTISTSGSYKLVKNITLTSTFGACLTITADFVTINLAGFTISGPASLGVTGVFAAVPNHSAQGLTLRNGSISGFGVGVDFDVADGFIVEGLHISNSLLIGMQAGGGIVKGNTATNTRTGITASGTITGNYASFNMAGFIIRQGSTVIGNTATNNEYGITSDCPSNLIDNTAVNNSLNLDLRDQTCHSVDNVAP